MTAAPFWLVALSALADVALFAWWTRRRRAHRRDARATLDAVRDWFWWREIAPKQRDVAESLARTRSVSLEDAARAVRRALAPPWRMGGSP